MYWGDHYWGMHMFWWIFWLALTVLLVFWAWPREAVRRDSALDTLRRRYAAGEISDEEYHHRLAVLAGRGQSSSTRTEAQSKEADQPTNRSDGSGTHAPSGA